MASVRAQMSWVAASAALITALMAHSILEYLTHLSGALPYTHAEVGIGQLEEGRFAPTAEGIPPDGLPWVLDSSAGWSEEERAAAADPARLLGLCARRYPRWCAGQTLEPPGGSFGAVLELAPGPRLVLERSQGVELALDKEGLVARQVAP